MRVLIWLYHEKNSPNFNQATVALNLLVSLFCCLVRGGRKVVTDRQTDTHTLTNHVYTVTLAAHAR